jgi:hypothetical protein
VLLSSWCQVVRVWALRRVGAALGADDVSALVIFGRGGWRMRGGTATASAPVQEINNVSAKYATTG